MINGFGKGKYFGVSPEVWMNLQTDHDLRVAKRTTCRIHKTGRDDSTLDGGLTSVLLCGGRSCAAQGVSGL